MKDFINGNSGFPPIPPDPEPPRREPDINVSPDAQFAPFDRPAGQNPNETEQPLSSAYPPPFGTQANNPAGAQTGVPGQPAAPQPQSPYPYMTGQPAPYYYYPYQTQNAHPGGQYNPYAAFQPQPKKKGGCLRVAGLVTGTIAGILIFAFAIAFMGEMIRPDYIGTTSGYTSSQETPSLPGLDGSNGQAESAAPFTPGENADPNGPSLQIFSPPGDPTLTLSPKEIAAKFKASVVSISVHLKDEEISPDTLEGEGTGIVMTADGYILTNSHVIRDSLSHTRNIVVTTNTQKEYTAKVVGFDTRTDLAALKIDANNLTPAEFGDSTKLEVGDPLVAIGNGGGIKFAGSVTYGIVSAVNRAIDSEIEGAVRYIQTDAAINPGNSGGPLINEYGQVIGVNTAKISGYGYEGMGFAIPCDTVKPIVDDLIHTGYVTGRARLGVTCETVYGLTGTSVVIREFSDDSGFHNTEAKIDDVIVEMDGHEIYTVSDVFAVINNHKPGDTIKVKLLRQSVWDGGNGAGGEENAIEISVKLLPDLGQTQQVSPGINDSSEAIN